MDDLDFFYPGPDYEGHREAIKELINKPEIKYTYHETLAANPGESDKIKQELADKFNVEVSTIEKYISRI